MRSGWVEMTSKQGRRIAWIALGIAAVVAVAAIAFHAGAQSGHDGGPMMRRGFGGGMMGWDGAGSSGAILGLILVFVVIFLFVVLLTGAGSDRSAGPTGPAGPGSATLAGAAPITPGHDVDRLRELSELHDRGNLTDEEFAAAKRKLLGL